MGGLAWCHWCFAGLFGGRMDLIMLIMINVLYIVDKYCSI